MSSTWLAVNDVDGSLTNEVSENAAVGTTVGITADAVDSDATTNGITYSLVDNDGGRFAIDSGTGVVTVAGAIDLETDGAVRTITIRANSDDGSFFDQVFTIDILNVNEAPVMNTAASFTVNEFTDTTGGYTVANLSALDVDAGDSLSFSIVGGLDAADFRVVGNQLQLDAGLMDFETRNQFNVIVQVSDAGGLWDQQSITVFVNDLNDRPQVSLTNVVPSIAENTDTTAGIRVADIQIQDDALGTNQLRLTGADAGHFEIVGNQVLLRAGTTLDYESRTSFDVIVEVDDNGFAASADSIDTLHLLVSNVNEAPAGSTDTFSSDQFGELTLSPSTLLANDSDVDGDWMTIVVVQQPTHGTLTVQANGSLLYTPPSDFEGVDLFQYVVSDGQLTSNPVDVQIDIQPLGSPVTPVNPGNNGPTIDEPSNPDSGEPSDPAPPAVPNVGDNSNPSAPEDHPSVVATPVLVVGSGEIGFKSESGQQDIGTVEVLQDNEQDREEAYQRRINEHLARISRSIESSYSVSSADRSFFADAVSISPLSLTPISQMATTEETDGFEFQELVVGTTAITTTTLSVGYVIWLIRGGSLIASFVSALPTWTSFDPLPVVQQANEEEDRESLLDIVRGKIRRAKR